MFMSVNLQGSFDLDKSNLKSHNLQLVIGIRHKPSANKPKHFLLHKVSASSFKYISSLYPLSGNVPVSLTDAQNWTFDYQGKEYQLSIDKAANKAEIKPYCKPAEDSPSSINNGELV